MTGLPFLFPIMYICAADLCSSIFVPYSCIKLFKRHGTGMLKLWFVIFLRLVFCEVGRLNHMLHSETWCLEKLI